MDWSRIAALRAAASGGPVSTANPGSAGPASPAVTYTPDGVPRQPGFYNPTNPYDTGRHGEKNRERNNGQGGSVDWWDYDKGEPKSGASLDGNGMWTMGGGGGGGGGPASGLPQNPYAAGATLAAGLLGLRGFQPASLPPLASDSLRTDLPSTANAASALGAGVTPGPYDPGQPSAFNGGDLAGPSYEGALNLAALQKLLGGIRPTGPRIGI